jgi:predicted transcriptional regulator of viral defense system
MKDLKLIEKILINEGRIITTVQLSSYLTEYKDINKKISTLVDKGLLVKLKRGTYFISKIGSLGYLSISNYIIANIIGKQSFISFEAALKYHGLFNQGLKKYRSISLKQYLTKTLEKITYEYVNVKEEQYFGFNLEKVDGGNARIASKERALLDLLEYKRSINTVSLVLEKLTEHTTEIDFKLLIEYALNYSQTTIKTLGLLLDIAELNNKSKKLEKHVKRNSTSRMLNSSEKFSNKWRLYYNSILENQKV